MLNAAAIFFIRHTYEGEFNSSDANAGYIYQPMLSIA
jgi:hypothetical protein